MRKLLGIKNAAAAGEKAKKATRANLGDDSSFYYDEKLKAWVDKKGGSDAQASGDDGGLPPPPTGPPLGAPPTAPVPIASARSGAGAGDADAPSGPSSVNSTAGTAGSNPMSRSSSMSHVRNRYVDVFANAAPGDGDAPGESSSSNTLLAPVLPGGVPTSGALAPNAPGAGAGGAPKFFMPMVPSAQSMTSGTSQDGDTDTDTGATAGEGSGSLYGGATGVGRSGLRVATGATGGLSLLGGGADDDSAPVLLKGDSATASPKGKKARPPVDVRVEESETVSDANGGTGTPSLAGNEALGQWARALGKEDQDNSFKKRAGGADVAPGPGFFVPAPGDDAPEGRNGAADAGEASLLRSPGGGFGGAGGARGGGTGADDAGALLPRRSQGSNQGEAHARLSGGSSRSAHAQAYEAHEQQQQQQQQQQQHAAASDSAYAYQDGGAWAQADDGNWYWYPADGGEPVPWTGDAGAGAGASAETAAEFSTVAASAGTEPYASAGADPATAFQGEAAEFSAAGTPRAVGTRRSAETAPPDASLVEDDVDYDAQWQAALDAAYAAANDAEVAQARAEAEASAAREALMLREAEVQALRRAAEDATERESDRESSLAAELAASEAQSAVFRESAESLRAQLEALRVEVSNAEASASAWENRARDAERRAEEARVRANEANAGAPRGPRGAPESSKDSGDDGMPGGDAGDAAGDAVQAARAAGYRAGHADGTREAASAAEAEHDEQMADLLVCLGEEDRKIERLRALLEARGVDTEKVMDEIEAENEAALLASVRGEAGEDGGGENFRARTTAGLPDDEEDASEDDAGETSFASSVHFMADASAMPADGVGGAAGARRGGGAHAERNPETPTAGGARVLQDISLPDIPSFDEDAPAEARGGDAGGGDAGDGAASAATARFDEWNMSGEIARDGEASAFSPGGWDLNSPLVLAENESLERRADVFVPGRATEKAKGEDGGEGNPAVPPAPLAAAVVAAPAGGPFGGAGDDDAAFFEHLDGDGAGAAEPAPAPPPRQAVEYPAASNAWAEAAPDAGNAFSEYPAQRQTHEYPTPQQYSQPAAPAFYDPGASQPGSQHGSQYGGGSQQGSVPASPAWGAAAAPPAFFNPNAAAQAQYPAASQPPYQQFQQQQPPPQWGGSGVEDSAAQWGYAQQQWHAGK
jgi:hypothetical protein